MDRSRLPDLITRTRLLAVPVLWIFALQGRTGILAVGLGVAWATDALDGFLARRWKVESAHGERMDSFADGVVFLSAIAWVVMFRPEFLDRYRVGLAIWLGLGLVIHAVSLARFRGLPAMHLASAKAANVAGFLFIPWLIAYGTWAPVAAWLVLGIWLVAALETLWVTATRQPDENGRSVLRGLRR